jgi:cytochrome c-type biogenesis protein CcmH
MGEHGKAIAAYERAKTLAPDEPTVLLGLAEALARGSGQLTGEPEQLIDSVLELQPNNGNGLFMKGLALFQRDDVAGALQRWQQVKAMLAPGSEDAAAIQQYIAEAQQRLGLPTQAASAPTVAAAAVDSTPAPAAADGGKSVRVQVQLDPELQGRFSPDDTLFVFARATAGPPMPLAVQRLTAADLPVSLTLDDSMAMMPQMRLSNFDQVVIGARISKSGNAIPQSGDLQGEVQPVTPGQEATVDVLIDSIRP